MVLRCTCADPVDNPHPRDGRTEQGLNEPIDITFGDGTPAEMRLAVLGVDCPRG